MTKPAFSDRLRYHFDNTMSRGTVALVGWLALVTVVVVVGVSLVIWFAGLATGTNFVDLLWANLMGTLEADPLSEDPWTLRFAMLGITFTSLFVTSLLIGVLTAGIEGRLEELRKGRSKVIESGHTVILGWSSQVFPIVSELVVANANLRRSCVVILGDKDKTEMEEEICDKVGSTGRTRIVCRRGDPMEMADLEIVSLDTARSIIALAPEGKEPDSSVIKAVLAITNNPGRRVEPYHIVAEIRSLKNMEVARMVGRDELELLLAGDVVARIAAQTCLQSGLSVVYTELLDFAGDEIYFQAEPALVGKSFGEVLQAYEDSAVIGLVRDGRVLLNPPMDTRMAEGDQVIAISEDDDTVRVSGRLDLDFDEAAIQTGAPSSCVPRRVLILGWNWRASLIIRELQHYLPPGSSITLAVDVGEEEESLLRTELDAAGVDAQAVSVRRGDTTDRAVLDGLAIEEYDHVVLLSYSDSLNPQQADARTLVSLLHIRDIAERAGYGFSIVSEMLDIRNRNLAEVTRPDDFIVSDRLISLLLSQISENKGLGAVFAALFDPQGSEIYLRPAGDYVTLGPALNFYTVVEAARRRGEVALGYRLHAHASDANKAHGVVLNPVKSAQIVFEEQDRIIVLAEQ